jgi:hypothetical protein
MEAPNIRHAKIVSDTIVYFRNQVPVFPARGAWGELCHWLASRDKRS